MLPQHHLAVAAAVAAPLRRAGWSRAAAAEFVAAAVLIDVDHYLWYAWRTHDLSLRRAFEYHRQKYRQPRHWMFRPHWPSARLDGPRFLHSAPALALAFLLSVRWGWLLPAACGMLLHRIQDEAWSWFD